MKKINVEATKLNNEDVIATSGVTCKGKYHIVVDGVNVNQYGEEHCYIYKENASGEMVFQYGKPSAPELSNGAFPGGYYVDYGYVDLGTPSVLDAYYWDGSTWKKCSENHTFN